MGASGLAVAISGGVLWAWNGKRYDDWSRDPAASSHDQVQTATSIQRLDDIAIGCVSVGTGLVAAGAWLLLTDPSERE
jgi:hypothetical protein